MPVCLSFLFDQNQDYLVFLKNIHAGVMRYAILTSSLNKFLKHCFYLSIKVHYVSWVAGIVTRVPFMELLSLKSIPRVVLQ